MLTPKTFRCHLSLPFLRSALPAYSYPSIVTVAEWREEAAFLELGRFAET